MGESSGLASGKNACTLPGRIGARCTRARSSPCALRTSTASPSRHAEHARVGVGEEQRVAAGAGERIALGPHHRVELLAPAGREHEAALGHVDRVRRHHAEVRLAVGGREHAAFAQARAADLDRVAGLAQPLDARVARHDARDLGADRAGGLAAEAVGELGAHAARDVGEDLPLRPRLADARAGDLGAERDAPLGGGRRAAAHLLVARRGGQQHDGFARVDEHLVGHEDVLVHAHRRAARARRA